MFLVTEDNIFRVARSYAAACVLFRLCFPCVGDVFRVRSGSVLMNQQGTHYQHKGNIT